MASNGCVARGKQRTMPSGEGCRLLALKAVVREEFDVVARLTVLRQVGKHFTDYAGEFESMP
jgi:hypothetical protein